MKKIKSKKKDKKREKKKVGEKGKEGPEGSNNTPFFSHPRWVQKFIFHIRIVKRNRNEIEAQEKSDFEHPTKTKKIQEKKKENERT